MRPRKPTKHPNGIFQSFINGKRFPLGKNYQKAKVILRKLESDLAKGALVVGGAGTTQLTVGGKKDVHIKELAVRHLEWVKNNRAQKTFITRQHYICLFLDFIGYKMVSEITYVDLDGFYFHCRKHHGRGINAGSHSLRELKTTFRWGEEFGICDLPVRRFPSVKEKPPMTKQFTEDEIKKLLAEAPSDFADLVRFAVLTGLRPIELRTLKKSNIERCGSTSMLKIEIHKTSASARVPMPRSVPLSPKAVEIILRQTERHPQSEDVFLNGDGTPYTGDALRIRLARVLKRLGISPKPPYAFRHFFAFGLASNDINLAVMSQLMSHSGLEMTYRYAVCNAEHHIHAVSVMEKYV